MKNGGKSMQKKNIKGITLIALVITIIILLILSGISIAMLTGENGILTKATNAKKETEINQYYEKIELVRTELRLKNKDYSEPTLDQLQKEFSSEKQSDWVKNVNKEIVNDVDTIILETQEGYIFNITNSEITYVENPESQNLEQSETIKNLEEQIAQLTAENLNLNERISNLETKETELNSLKSALNQTDATESDIKKDKKAYTKNGLIIGTNENMTKTLTKLQYSNIARETMEKLTFSIKDKYADYSNITIDNISVQLTSIMSYMAESNQVNNLSYNYDRNTGIITIEANYPTFTIRSNSVIVTIYK